MQKSLVLLYRVVPVEVLYAVMACVIPFYMIFGHKGYLASYRYFRNRFDCSPLKAFWKVYCNHIVFGTIILDRFAMYAGKKFHIEKEGTEVFDDLTSREEGFVMLSSHVGNYELAGYSLSTNGRPFYALVFAGETETVMKNRSEMFARTGITMVPMSEDMSHIFTLNSAIVNGGIVSMPGDRIFGSSKSVSAELLGKDADFPMGPFALAVQRDVPAIATFVMKEGTRKYRIIMKKIVPGDTGSKSGKIEAMASSYAAHLSETLRRYPTQWFNFFDFWKEYEN